MNDNMFNDNDIHKRNSWLGISQRSSWFQLWGSKIQNKTSLAIIGSLGSIASRIVQAMHQLVKYENWSQWEKRNLPPKG